MKKSIKHLIVFAAAFLCLFAAMQWTVYTKDKTIDGVYRTAQENLRATELTQYITNLEFGIKYGKNLENYYNMDSVLQSILRSSSYVEGVYIVSNDSVLLYSAGEALPHPDTMTVLHSDRALYASAEKYGYAFMFMDISGQDGTPAGTLVVMLNNDIMNRLISSYQQEGRVQSIVILAEALVLFCLIYLRLSRSARRKLTSLGMAVLLSVTVLGAQAVDIGIEAAKLSVKLQTISSQSVQKIAQVLQQQVEGVMDKGVTVDEMYDIYGWLDDIDDQLDSVSRLDFTQDGRVRAELAQDYVRGSIASALWQMGFSLCMMALACALLCVLTWATERFLRARKAVQEGRYGISA